jgi:putative DNA primase/helicase
MTTDTETGLSLHPDHLADLRCSGLSDETIAAAGIRSLAPAELPRYLGQRLAAKVRSAYLIPYPSNESFHRVKLFPPVQDDDGHHQRYHQPARTPPRLYVPAGTCAVLADPSVPLTVTEGEKKALKADQDGLRCVAVGGLWNWLQAGESIADLDQVDFCERETIVVPDSDV